MDDPAVWIVGLVLGAFAGFVIALIAESKGLEGGKWFLYGFLVWPIALVHVIMAEPAAKMKETASLKAGEMKKCPDCAELVRKEARKCRYCGCEFAPAVITPPTPDAAQATRKFRALDRLR